MTSRQLGELGLRLFGVFLVVQAFALLPTMAAYLFAFSSDDLRGQVGVVSTAFLPIVILLLSAFMLLIRPGEVAARIFPDKGELTQIRQEAFEPVAFAMAGALIVAIAIPGLVSSAIAIVFRITGRGSGQGFPWSSLIASTMQATFGLLLLLRPTAVTSWWVGRKGKRASG